MNRQFGQDYQLRPLQSRNNEIGFNSRGGRRGGRGHGNGVPQENRQIFFRTYQKYYEQRSSYQESRQVQNRVYSQFDDQSSSYLQQIANLPLRHESVGGNDVQSSLVTAVSGAKDDSVEFLASQIESQLQIESDFSISNQARNVPQSGFVRYISTSNSETNLNTTTVSQNKNSFNVPYFGTSLAPGYASASYNHMRPSQLYSNQTPQNCYGTYMSPIPGTVDAGLVGPNLFDVYGQVNAAQNNLCPNCGSQLALKTKVDNGTMTDKVE